MVWRRRIISEIDFEIKMSYTPIYCIPFHSNPFHSIPIHSIPLNSNPIQSIPCFTQSLKDMLQLAFVFSQTISWLSHCEKKKYYRFLLAKNKKKARLKDKIPVSPPPLPPRKSNGRSLRMHRLCQTNCVTGLSSNRQR